MHLIDLDRANEYVDYLFEKMPAEDTIKLKSRLKSLSRRAPVFKSEEDEIDLDEVFGIDDKSGIPKKDFW